jgi:SH3 domain protein
MQKHISIEHNRSQMNMKKYGYIILMISVSCLVAQNTWADRAYVTDFFEITLRTGPTAQHKVIAMPASGQAVEVLETQEDWSLVRLLGKSQDDLEGWVRTRYLITRIPWKIQIEALNDENSRLREKIGDVERQLSDITISKQNLTSDLQENNATLAKLKNDYEALKQDAKGYIELKTQYDAASASLKSIETTAQALTKENEELKSSHNIRWFATGALVLLGGLVIGLVLGSKQKKRKSLYY